MREKALYPLFFLLLSLIPLGLGASSWAQQEGRDLAYIMGQLKKAQEAIQDFSADITQVKISSIFKEPMVSKGKMRFKRPNQIWVDMYPPYPSLTVLNKGVLWIYFPEERAAQRYQVAGNPLLAKWLLFFQNPIETMGKRVSLQEKKKGEVVLNIDPAEDLAIFQEIRLWIDTSNWMLKRLEMLEKNGDLTTISYHHIRINSGIPDSSFELHLPPDVEIIEPMSR
ncbi:MAG: outer membrane lipoprotein carrier protein LolA [Deltaproteobacteria bacterium]|nr:outer membrane lipoprotein carrier protein LolA [Deltaproteobacteria bacterium]